MIQIRMFGCKVELSFLFVAVTACSVLLDHTGCVIHTLLASFFHECGHLAAMGFLGGAAKKVAFGIFHIDIQDNRRVKRGYYQDIFILLAGPIVNLVLCLLLLIGFGVFHQQIFLFAASTNLLIGFFNLLPVESLDGGQILYAVLCKRKSLEQAQKWVQIISFLVLLPIACLGFFILLRSKYNFSLLLASCYLMGQLLLRKTYDRFFPFL